MGIMMVGLMACVFSAALSAGFAYTCTGGSFDPDDFDTDKCLELFPEDDDDGGGGGGGGDGGDGGSEDAPSSQDLTICGTQFFSNESRTCFTGSEQVGVRWAWLNNDTASSCREKVAKYLVEISSSKDNHNTKKMYSVVGKDSNSIIISGAGSFMVQNGNKQNVKIYITPLDASGAKISQTAVAEVDTSSSNTDTCDAIGGTAVALSSFTDVSTSSSSSSEGGTDCVGGTWSAPGPCMADDGVTVLTGEPGKCGAGTAKLTLSGYTPPTGGGTCVTEKRERCTNPCPVETPTPCVLARLPNGEINWNPYPGTPDYNATCRTQCAASGAATESIFASADVLEDAQGTGACNYTQTTTCTCPRDCVGHWQRASSTETRDCLAVPNSWPVQADYMSESFIVDTPANETGSCPDQGRVRKTRQQVYKKYFSGPTQITKYFTVDDQGRAESSPLFSSSSTPIVFQIGTTTCPAVENT